MASSTDRAPGFDDDWFARAAAGKLRIPGDGNDFVSLIHITDMAAATTCAIERWPSHNSLIISDDEPVRWADLFTYIAQVAGTHSPDRGGLLRFPSFRTQNTRARDALQWTPLYASYRSGLVR